MNLKELYEEIEGDYDDVMGRFMSPAIVEKFVVKFLDDKSFELLQDALQENDDETAFRAAHTMKGVCQNLSFTKLFESSNALTEALRGGRSEDADELNEKLISDYQQTIDAIKSLVEQ